MKISVARWMTKQLKLRRQIFNLINGSLLMTWTATEMASTQEREGTEDSRSSIVVTSKDDDSSILQPHFVVDVRTWSPRNNALG